MVSLLLLVLLLLVVLSDLGHTLMISLNLNYLLDFLIFKYSSTGVRISTYKFGVEGTIPSKTSSLKHT